MIKDKEPPSEGKILPGGDLLHGREGAPPIMGIEINDLDGNPIAGGEDEPEVSWMQRAREAYQFSTSYLDANYRKKWEDGIRAFNNQHPMDSKYSSPNYNKRSNLYRPKTRAVIRKNEAAASQAFFANPDAITCEAHNQADKKQQASAEVMKQLVQYRLEKTIPWYITCIGGLQDAQKTGAVAAHTYWDYRERDGVVEKDTPCIDLLPVENIRIDPGADWRDPIQSSPYVIELIPMYLGDVMERMEKVDQKTGAPVWKRYGLGTIRQATQDKTDSTRLTRNKDRQDPLGQDNQSISDYEIVWVHRHIHRYQGEDWTFYTLSDVALLTDPVLLKTVVHHGKRPYVLGCAILETHTIMSSGVPELAAGLQRETNEVANSRLDNVYFVLNKMWLVKRGQNTDLPALVRNSPGRVALTNDPEKDIKEVNWPDVTPSAYQEQDRINADFADLTGDFSAHQAQISRKGQEPGKVMALMAQAGNPLTEYLLRTYVVTFVEPVLRQLVLLEQEYETDATIIAIAGQKAQLMQKFGMDRVTDDMLRAQLTIKVNVGMGATDPFQKLQKFLMGIGQFKEIAMQAPPGLSLTETAKEIFGLLGYQDGARFFGDKDPEKEQLKAQLQHAGQVIQELGKRHEDKEKEYTSKEKISHESNLTSILTAAMGKDPMIARFLLKSLGPGQGIQIPDDLPMPKQDGGEDKNKVVQEQEFRKERLEREKMQSHERIERDKTRVGALVALATKEMEGKVKDKLDQRGGEREEKRATQEREDAAKGINKKESVSIAIGKENKEESAAMKALIKEFGDGQQELAKLIAELVKTLAQPTTKETTIKPASDGGFTMKTTERVAK